MITNVFVDRATVPVRAGHGGAGSAHMHSEPFKPRGGPDGGDGGAGGDVILRVDTSMFDLSSYRDRPRFQAESGGAGARNNRTGARGSDVVIPVPDGTVASDERGQVADLVGEGTTVVVARGGRGGRGNASLVTRSNRVPRVAEPGEAGEEHVLQLELKLVVDVGLVGLPNAGKSTLLAALTAARPKIANYPFTTLTPNLGVTTIGTQRVLVADVPGLIEGAHQGRGLGLEFLRHVSRAKVLAYVVDLTGEPEQDLATLRGEIHAYDPALAARPSIHVGTKLDLLSSGGSHDAAAAAVDIAVSGLTGEHVDDLERRLGELVQRAEAEQPPREPFVVIRPGRDPFTVQRSAAGWRVSGPRVERWVREIDIDDEHQVATLQRRLIRAGVERRLTEAGARPGDDVTIAGATFEFQPDADAQTSSAQGTGRTMENEPTRAEADGGDQA
jgi:GTP-binding protein